MNRKRSDHTEKGGSMTTLIKCVGALVIGAALGWLLAGYLAVKPVVCPICPIPPPPPVVVTKPPPDQPCTYIQSNVLDCRGGR